MATRAKSEFFVGEFGNFPEGCGLPGIKFYKTDILTIIAVIYVLLFILMLINLRIIINRKVRTLKC